MIFIFRHLGIIHWYDFYFQTFRDHPLVLDYCAIQARLNTSKNTTLSSGDNMTISLLNISSKQGYSIVSNYSDHDSIEAEDHDKYSHHKDLNQPNTALMSTILTLGTFLIAHFLRIFRNSKFLGRRVSIEVVYKNFISFFFYICNILYNKFA
jgi:hypothetical protein